MPLSEAAYLIGRRQSAFPAAGQHVDCLFAAERLDGRVIQGVQFKYCTFANISFKEAELAGVTFEHCVFIGCYFRKAVMRDCKLPGCRFIACDFPRIRIQSSDFRYAHFDRCAILFAELEHNLPSEPNLREELARGLALAAEQAGLSEEARLYRLEATQAMENHLAAGVRGASSWYQEHYQGARKVGAAIRWAGSKANGLIWGHGERPIVLLRNVALLAVGLFPLLLWATRDAFSVNGGRPELDDAVWLSVVTLIPVGGIASVTEASTLVRAILTAESMIGIVVLGLLGAMLLKRITMR